MTNTVLWLQFGDDGEAAEVRRRLDESELQTATAVPHAVEPTANVCSLLTGRPPSVHECWTTDDRLSLDVETLSERLVADGVETRALRDGQQWDETGAWRGFEEVTDLPPADGARGEAIATEVERAATADTDCFLFVRIAADGLTGSRTDVGRLIETVEAFDSEGCASFVSADPTRPSSDAGESVQPVGTTAEVDDALLESELVQPLDLLWAAVPFLSAGGRPAIAADEPRTYAYTQHRSEASVETWVRTDEYRYLSGDTTEQLLHRESGEDRTVESPDVTRRIRRQTSSWLDEHGESASRELRKQLRDLGYM